MKFFQKFSKSNLFQLLLLNFQKKSKKRGRTINQKKLYLIRNEKKCKKRIEKLMMQIVLNKGN